MGAGHTDHHGSGTATQVSYHYKRDTTNNLYYNDWTKDENGSLSYTELNSYGQLARTIQDVNTGTLSCDLGWSNTTGLHLTTTYTQDNWGRTQTVVTPSGTTRYWYASRYDSSRDEGTTTNLVTLSSPFVDAFSVLPLDISVSDMQGRTVISARGMTPNGAATDLPGHWNAGGTVDDDFTAFLHGGAHLYSRTVNTYDQTNLIQTDRWTTAEDKTALRLSTTFTYSTTTGWQYKTISPDGLISWTEYDQMGRAKSSWLGSDAAGAMIGNPSNSGANGMKQLSATFYDESAPGSGTDGVGQGNVTQEQMYYSSTGYYRTVSNYDYRDRLTASLSPESVASVNVLDNLGRSGTSKVYANATLSSGVITTASGDLRSKSETLYDEKGQVYQSIVYEVEPNPATAGRSPGAVNATMTTDYWYDPSGRNIKSKGPDGVFSKTIYNGLGQVLASAVSTDADDIEGSAYEAAGNLSGDTIFQVAFSEYDTAGRSVGTWQGTALGSAPVRDNPNGGSDGDMVKTAKTWHDTTWDGNGSARPYVTGSSTLKPLATLAGTSADFVLTKYEYDSAGRQNAVIYPSPASGVDPLKVVQEFDDLDRVLYARTYSGSSTLIAQSQSVYTGGRLSASKVFKVDGGTAGDYMQTSYDYDDYGRTCKVTQPSGAFSKTQYNQAGQVIGSYLCTAEGTGPKVLTSDTVVEQSKPTYDATTGQAWLTTRWQRWDDGSGTGELSSSNARITYDVAWFDDAGRTIKSVTYGTNSTTAGNGTVIDGKDDEFNPGGTSKQYASDFGDGANFGPQVNASDRYIVAKSEYDGFGRAYQFTDNLGHVTRSAYDAATGRLTHRIENFKTDGSQTYWYQTSGKDDYDRPKRPANQNDANRITAFTYDTFGQTLTMTALDPACDDNESSHTDDNQTTTYTYNDGSTTPCAVPRKDLLVKEKYPDGDDSTNNVQFAYYANGMTHTKTDQRGVAHEFLFDDIGRLTADKVTSLGSSGIVNGDVRCIGRAYEAATGRLSTITSYSDAAGTTAVNSILYNYDGWGNIIKSYQRHTGAATGTGSYVGYTYEELTGNGSGKNVRLQYYRGQHNDRIYYLYTDDAIGDKLNRPESQATYVSTTTKQVQYSYLGAGTIVKESRTQVTGGGLELTFKGSTSGNYDGLDRFGRVVDHKWQTTGGTVKDEYKYGYDKGSNRLWKENTLSAGLGELYHYDGLDRLKDYQRGTLNAGHDAITGAVAQEEDFGLSQTGNWDSYTFKTGGNTTLAQTRKHNVANEIYDATDAIGQGGGQAAWTDPAYDLAGNMTAMPSPLSLTTSQALVYDAWNRLVKVGDDWEYQYDGLDRRTAKLHPWVDDDDNTYYDREDLYYNESWQVTDEYWASGLINKTTTGSFKRYWMWSQRYIDAPVLCYDDSEVGWRFWHFTTDANMSVTARLFPTGAIDERHVYDPYGGGGEVTYNSQWTAFNNTYNSAKVYYCGYRYDPETGLYHVRNRYYHPKLGRWITRDPAGYVDGASLYEYCMSGPVASVDPSAKSSTPQRGPDMIYNLMGGKVRKDPKNPKSPWVDAPVEAIVSNIELTTEPFGRTIVRVTMNEGKQYNQISQHTALGYAVIGRDQDRDSAQLLIKIKKGIVCTNLNPWNYLGNKNVNATKIDPVEQAANWNWHAANPKAGWTTPKVSKDFDVDVTATEIQVLLVYTDLRSGPDVPITQPSSHTDRVDIVAAWELTRESPMKTWKIKEWKVRTWKDGYDDHSAEIEKIVSEMTDGEYFLFKRTGDWRGFDTGFDIVKKVWGKSDPIPTTKSATSKPSGLAK